MIGNALEQDILGLYNRDISSMYSINQIATLLNKKYPYINKKVTSLVADNIFKVTIVGKSHLCSINLKNEETIHALILNEIRQKNKELEKEETLRKIVDYVHKISRTIDLKVVLKTKRNILFISENKEICDEINRGILKHAFHNYEAEFLTKKEFLARLVSDEDLLKDRLILYGFEKYYELIRLVEDELKIRYSKLMP